MTGATGTEARLNFRISSDLKRTIERAATLTGQTVSDFAIATLVDRARVVLEEGDRTELTDRDRDRFMDLLDQMDSRPNPALVAAARRYKKRER